MSTPTLPAVLPASLSLDDVMDALERRMTCLDEPGFCLACGAEADGCEPDARQYPCSACEARGTCGEGMVFGAEEVCVLYG